MKLRSILAAIALAIVVAVPALAAEYSTSGKARWNDRLILEFTVTTPGDVTAVATFSGNPAWVKLWVYNVNDEAVQCQQLNRPASTVTCTITDAPAGSYRAEFWPSSSNVTATITVTTPD